ncbi:MAG TPA: SMC family ATPase [Dehalococcoidia bacterium]|nr:SMC family ATPase [Dehalococcoidia bacterium]
MIPIRIALRNFMCYLEGELSFEGLHVACLCGDNGNGKSALLDAITWALWGKARAKSDDELIYLGRTEMGVEFEFAVMQEGRERYRVLRKRSKPKLRGAGKTLLELQQATDQGYRSISGNSVRETQREIEKILRMNYDTFINSTFLLQGHADEFTKKEPYRRKEILADILGLSRYDELEDRSKNYARQKDRAKRDLEIAIDNINAELANKAEYQTQLREVGEAIAEVEKERCEWEKKVNALTNQKSELDWRKKQQEEIEGRIKQAGETVSSFEYRVRDHHQRAEKYEKVIAGHEEELAKVRVHLDAVAKQESVLVGRRGEYEKTSNLIHHVTSANASLKEEMKQLREKLDMLSQEEATCPLCGTELGVEGRRKIMASYEDEGRQKKELFRTNEDEKRRLETGLNALKREIGELERMTREGRAQWDRGAETLEKEHTEAESSLPKEKEALAMAEENLRRWRSTLDADTQRRDSINADLAILPELEDSLSSAQQTHNELTRREAQGRQKLGEIQANLGRFSSLELSRGEKKAERDNVTREEKIYEELAAAFGKKGIQALIIDTALPEIEEEANRLLARMTDNRMSVKIETQRAYKTKKEESVETLDINISDELGMRRYEMYSGGEAFRIDFALRIALSKLLARRAGAPLPTLIIDEGFGSQDSSGRERLVEAINSIQDDFEKILVITHIEDLRDAFDERIEVTKGTEGSLLKVS